MSQWSLACPCRPITDSLAVFIERLLQLVCTICTHHDVSWQRNWAGARLGKQFVQLFVCPAQWLWHSLCKTLRYFINMSALHGLSTLHVPATSRVRKRQGCVHRIHHAKVDARQVAGGITLLHTPVWRCRTPADFHSYKLDGIRWTQGTRKLSEALQVLHRPVSSMRRRRQTRRTSN